MSQNSVDKVNILKLSLHGELVGYLTGYIDGRNTLTISEAFKNNKNRPTLSLITHPLFPNSDKVMAKPWMHNQRLHPLLSNLLPEGTLRALIAQGLKVHMDNEFYLLSYLGEDLPGALVATPMKPEDVSESALNLNRKVEPVWFEKGTKDNKFSLAGVQMKFSMKEKDGRYNLSQSGAMGDWIIKTPSTQHKFVPLNEYTAMSLAALAGVEVPEIKLVELNMLDNLPRINLPNETYAFAIKRFDRNENMRIHTEDFAQVLVKYPHEKYSTTNYEQIGKVIYQYSGDGLADAQQFARRLLVNILLANGDAHLKNWSLIYQDQVTPRLAPAYDIVTTNVYIENETDFALNLKKNKNWYQANMSHFEGWANKVDIPWRAIKPHLENLMEIARDTWPNALKNLPMEENHKEILVKHWKNLHSDFRIK